MSRPLRWGVLSTARIGATVIDANRGSDVTDFVAVASRDAEKATDFAARHGLAHSFRSYQDLLASSEVDAVYVPLPMAMHTTWTVAALQAGKHVLCEKPFTVTAADAARCFDAAEAAGVRCVEGLMWRHHPQTDLARRLVADGAIGRLRLVRAALTVTVPPGDIRRDSSLGGGALLDLGCYCVSALRLFAGEPERVHAETIYDGDGMDLRTVATARLPAGVLGAFDIGVDHPRRDELELVGTDATLVVPDPWIGRGSDLLLRRGDQVERVPVPGTGEGADEDAVYRIALDLVSTALRDGGPLPFGRDDAVAQARVLEAVDRSGRQGVPVELPS